MGSAEAARLLKTPRAMVRQRQALCVSQISFLRDPHTVKRTAVQQFKVRSLGHPPLGLSIMTIMTELCALYATDRDANKPLSSNDWFDSSHAAAALPYCDVFLTEKTLAHKLRQMLKAHVQYGCQVIGSSRRQ